MEKITVILVYTVSCLIGLVLVFSGIEDIRKIGIKNYQLGYNQGLEDVKKIIDKQVVSPRSTVSKVHWDDTLVYWIHYKKNQ